MISHHFFSEGSACESESESESASEAEAESEDFASPVGIAYKNDPSLPVFSWKASAYSAKSIVRILLTSYAPEYLCISPPTDVENNVAFLVDNKHLSKYSDIKCDDMGSWSNNGTPKNSFQVKRWLDGGIKEVTPCVSQQLNETESEIYVLKRSYHINSSDGSVRKILSTLQGLFF